MLVNVSIFKFKIISISFCFQSVWWFGDYNLHSSRPNCFEFVLTSRYSRAYKWCSLSGPFFSLPWQLNGH